jgi:hypothetical protein
MEVVFHLLKAKASVFSAHDNGATPLELAERSKHPGIRRLVRAAAKAASA